MKLTLLSHTPNALELLLFTKQTRLSMDAGLMEEITAWPMAKKLAELNYMLGTIESSWEFVDYTFSIEGVSRAFTHQLVRTRAASFAQQSQRTVDMSGFEYVTPDAFLKESEELIKDNLDSEGSDLEQRYHTHMRYTNTAYEQLCDMGANPQDARAILPTNVATSIIAKFNLRTLSDMAEKRLCYRTQGEYQTVFRAMRDAVLQIHPWADEFIRVACAKRGVCQFPNFKECPIKPGIFNPDTGGMWPNLDGSPIWERLMVAGKYVSPLTKSEIQVRWEGTRFEAVPKGSGR